MSFYYAQINEQNICSAVSELAVEMSESNLISINTFDTSLLGKLWNGSSWEEVLLPPQEPTT
jgi:hypothetical protein